MQVAVDISLYPLDADFIPPIKDVIARLNTHADISVVTNPMATQISHHHPPSLLVMTLSPFRAPRWSFPRSVCKTTRHLARFRQRVPGDSERT